MFPWIMFPNPNALFFVPAILFYFPTTLLSEPLMRFFPDVKFSSFGSALMLAEGGLTLTLTLAIGGLGLVLALELTGLGLTLGLTWELLGYWGPDGFGEITQLASVNRAKIAVRAKNFIFELNRF